MTAQLLDVDHLLAEAMQQTGLQDFGDDDHLEPLAILVDSLNNEAALNDIGVALQAERLTELLKNRLRLQAFISRHPEILQEQLAPPVIILGLPRTGTTMLQRLLSTDKRFLPINWYEVRFPVPALDWDFTEASDERILMAKAEVEGMIAANPDLLSIHPLDAMQPDEDIMLLEGSFVSGMPASQVNVPGYNDYYERNSALTAYAYHKKLLQFLQWQRRRAGQQVDGKPWLLKTPAHMYTIEAVLATYPDAKLITSHRNPLACIPSVASLFFAAWVIYADNPDPTDCGEYTSQYFHIALQRLQAAANRRPEQFLDIEYESLVNEQDDTLAKIYNFLGWDQLPETLAGFAQWRNDNRRDKRKPHNYSLQEYGLDEQQLTQRFASYGKDRGYF